MATARAGAAWKAAMAGSPGPLVRAVAGGVLMLLAACGYAADRPSDTPASDGPPASSPTPEEPASPTPTVDEGLVLVTIGDSIPNNAPEDCPGCIGFVEQYAAEVERATGETVEVQNFSDHTGLTLERLLDGLQPLEQYLAEADVIVVAIAHNSNELCSERPCGAPLTGAGFPRWDSVDARCAADAARHYRPLYDRLFARVAGTRQGVPTILRTVNRYNDWIGWADGHLTADQERRSKVVLDAWNDMLCASAERHGFGCADAYRAFNGPDGLRPSGALVADDYTHPSQRGNDSIAALLAGLGYEPLA